VFVFVFIYVVLSCVGTGLYVELISRSKQFYQVSNANKKTKKGRQGSGRAVKATVHDDISRAG
jgi:hypothetical protein